MSDQAVPARDERVEVVTFNTQWGSYYAGESAAFSPLDAAALKDLGVVGEGGGEAPQEAAEFHVALAGIDNPPRYWPPNPQHPEIVQTYDPMVRHQMERAKRDLDAGKPGSAAQEDLERMTAEAKERAEREPRPGAGPQPYQRRHPGQTPPPPQAEGEHV